MMRGTDNGGRVRVSSGVRRAGRPRRKVSEPSADTDERSATSGMEGKGVAVPKKPRPPRPTGKPKTPSAPKKPRPPRPPSGEEEELLEFMDGSMDGSTERIPSVPDDISELDGMHTMDGVRARPTSRNLDPSQLYRGRARLALLRDLALNEWSDSAIAQSVGVPAEIITDFRLTYESEIAEVRASLAGQLAIESAGLWISKKYNRLAEMQQDFEDIDVVIDAMREKTKLYDLQKIHGGDDIRTGDAFDVNMLLGSRRHQNLLRAKISLLKAVADELAQRGQNKEDDAKKDNQIRYVILQEDGDDDILRSLS